MSARLTCKRCLAFHPLPTSEASWNGEWGECHRRAPSLDGASDHIWPRVQPHHWCLQSVPGPAGGGDA